MILSAPLILPMEGPPIENGAVLVHGDTIADLGPSADLEKKYPKEFLTLTKLSDCALLPGFVNAHSHLELTCLEGFKHRGGFTDWIRKLVDSKPKISEADYQSGLAEGIRRMVESGITTVGDHVSFNTDLEAILKGPLRGILFVEVLGVVPEMAQDLLDAAKGLVRYEKRSTRFKIIPSPHSAHAIHPEILSQVFLSESPVFSIHLGESEEEDLLFRERKGALFDLIAERSPQALPSESLGSGLKYLERKGLLSSKIMAVHGNYLDEEDLNLLAKHHISIIHCPRSHAYFVHRKFPLKNLRQRGINIALGTDSLASGDSLSLLDQMRTAKENDPEIPAGEWIRMVTLNGAKALKMEREIGSLAPGKKADLIAFKISPHFRKDLSFAFQEILKAEKVEFSMIGGETIYHA